jgi:hypothetical protein
MRRQCGREAARGGEDSVLGRDPTPRPRLGPGIPRLWGRRAARAAVRAEGWGARGQGFSPDIGRRRDVQPQERGGGGRGRGPPAQAAALSLRHSRAQPWPSGRSAARRRRGRRRRGEEAAAAAAGLGLGRARLRSAHRSRARRERPARAPGPGRGLVAPPLAPPPQWCSPRC